jgi:hypothetical protein|eukprot:COSAG06_NODE_1057_length_10905_cov_6.405793_9_plen_89_part_00
MAPCDADIPPSNPACSAHLLPFATSDLQRQLLDSAWVGRDSVAFPAEAGPPVTIPNPEESGAGRNAVAEHAAMTAERRAALGIVEPKL